MSAISGELHTVVFNGGIADAKNKKNNDKQKESLRYQGEQCVDAVWGLVGWANDFRGAGAAANWVNSAKSKGYDVNHNPTGCSKSNPCIVVYPTNYGAGINPIYGHVAVLYGCGGKCNLQDSNGVCGGTRSKCEKSVNFQIASIIHPK